MRDLACRVDLTQRASEDLDLIYDIVAAEGSARARLWLNHLERIISSLDMHPARSSVTSENRRFRQLLHGTKPNVYSVIYRIDEPNKTVTVLHIPHGLRADYQPHDLEPNRH